MTVQTESQLESALVTRLQGKGWEPVRLASEAELWANLRGQLGLHNGTVFSDGEFARIRNHLEKGNPFEKAHTLRDRFHLTRDDGTSFYVQFFNTEFWCRNQYQVATQIGLTGARKNRYDVTLLVNGLPLAQIELKRRGGDLKQAFNQINRYQKDSFAAAGGLFQFVQIFVISNGVDTRYYANNRHQSFEQTFAWAGIDNKPINRLDAFADIFLEKCQLSKMIAKYVVLHQSDKVMMVLRSYQYYAAEAILDRVAHHKGNGYVWHTTGSGKTLTSFKAAQNLVALPKVEKVVFVVDRADLDDQTVREFNAFKEDSVDQTDNTHHLVRQLADPTARLVITTIQKLNNAISGERYAGRLEGIREGRVVFIFDECHRSQFGETHRRIVDFFPRAQLFGFTGTPILVPNAIGRRTTADLFGDRLHTYVITDAIRDRNVLRFSVEYMGVEPPKPEETGDKEEDRRRRKLSDRLYSSRAFFDHPDRIDAITDWVIANHDTKTRGRQFGAIMAVPSVDALIQYYETFDAKRRAGLHDLKIATIFTYAANPDDVEADGLLPDTGFPDSVAPRDAPKRDKLAEFVAHYNETYGTNESVSDGKGFYTYYRSLAKRVKSRDRKPFDAGQGVDILLVVNMFLTGFDARTVNTLYVDKNLRWHGLIQAFSRTNRVLNAEKSQGNIVCFRDLKENTDEAIALFADKNAREVILIGSYEEHLARHAVAVQALLEITPNADAVDDLVDEEEQAAFVKAFRDVIRVNNVLASFAEFQPDDLTLPAQDFEDFKSKYLDLSQRGKGGGEGDPTPGALEDIDFELELLRRDDINVAYILALLTSLSAAEKGGKASRKSREMRRRIFELLLSEVQLRDKRELIEAFIDQKMPMLGPEDDVRAAFAAFWAEERAKAFAGLIEAEHLDPAGFEILTREMLITGKRPAHDAVVAIMTQKPGILARKAAIARVLDGIETLLATFDDGVGELDGA
ncbi:type I restriction endonuclease subunit R [Paracoccus sp. IB05]|uniref:type I restriction endonuclease subunit R n=1 Tax=Paracoccus sp. IB05 TaxID=2779367 RepID=UPI0018E7FFD3|nr:type I restriction endonuclease subunit R [Paracoccus sp. IB05]MBJ2152671.1 type I restriction endonuclease subunit R [Paracoccus sp. IB05]